MVVVPSFVFLNTVIPYCCLCRITAFLDRPSLWSILVNRPIAIGFLVGPANERSVVIKYEMSFSLARYQWGLM